MAPCNEMGAIKEKLKKLRTAKPDAAAADAHGPAQAEGAPPAAADPTPTPPAGAGRFGRLAGTSAGNMDFADEAGGQSGAGNGSPDLFHQDDDIPFEVLPPKKEAATAPAAPPTPAAAPAQPPQRRAFAAAAGRAAADQQLRSIIESWADPLRPAASSYDAAEWDRASENGTMVVFEMVKPDQIGLCAIPRETLNEVEALLYDRSLIVSEGTDGFEAYPKHAAMIHRSSELRATEVIRYKIVRSQQAIEKTPWLNGSVLRNEEEVAHNARQAEATSRGNGPEPRRFANMPRQR